MHQCLGFNNSSSILPLSPSLILPLSFSKLTTTISTYYKHFYKQYYSPHGIRHFPKCFLLAAGTFCSTATGPLRTTAADYSRLPRDLSHWQQHRQQQQVPQSATARPAVPFRWVHSNKPGLCSIVSHLHPHPSRHKIQGSSDLCIITPHCTPFPYDIKASPHSCASISAPSYRFPCTSITCKLTPHLSPETMVTTTFSR